MKVHFTVLVLCFVSGASRGAPLPAAGQAISAQRQSLSFGQSWKAVLSQNDVLSYHLGTTAGQFLGLSAAERLSQVEVTLVRPDGSVQRRLPCWHEGYIRISEIAQATGDYVLTLRLCDPRTKNVSLTLSLSPLRSRTPTDQARVAAERAVSEAEAQIWEYRAGGNERAEKKYEEALIRWTSLGDQLEKGRTLAAMGQLLSRMGRTDTAIQRLNEALAIARTLGEPQSIVQALTDLSAVYITTGDSKALGLCTEALEMSSSTSSPYWYAKSQYCIAEFHYWSGNNNAAIEHYKESLFHWAEDRLGEARTLANLAINYSELSEFALSAEYNRRALDLFRLMADRGGQAQCLMSLGTLESKSGNKQAALSVFDEARTLLRNSGDAFSEGALLNSIAVVHRGLGNVDVALEFHKSALSKYRQIGHRLGEAVTAIQIGEVYYSLNNLPEALSYFEESLKIERSLSNRNRRVEAYSLRNLGLVYLSSGEGGKAIEYFNQALELNHAVADRRQEAYTLASIGHVHETLGDFERAIEFYNRGLTLNRSTQDVFGQIASLYRIASSERGLNQLQEGLGHTETAISMIERLRSSVASYGLRTSYFASVREHYDLYIDFLMDLHRKNPTVGFDVKSIEISERSRARSLLDKLGEARITISEGVEPDLANREKSMRTLLDVKSERYTQLLSTAATGKEVTQISEEIRKLSSEYDELQGQIRLRSPRYAALVQPEPLTLGKIQNELLDHDSLLLEYAVDEKNSYLWAVTHDAFESYVLPKRSVIEAKVRRLRELMTARLPLPKEKLADFQLRIKTAEAEYPKVAAELSEMLLGPVGDRLGTRRLVIVPEGILQYLPFGALPTPQSAATTSFTPLIVDHEIVNLPSASTLAVIRSEAPMRGTPDKTVAIFADPVFEARDSRVQGQKAPTRTSPTMPRSATTPDFNRLLRGNDGTAIDLPRLLSTRREAEAILAMVPAAERFVALDFNATKAAAMNPDLKRYRIVHFATHTVLNDEHPDLSSLVMSLVDQRGNAQNGFLRLRDMYSLSLSAELVVLSACDTALGKEIKGEGLMSMVRGFMYSGTPRVLASLWKVDDDATAELMQEFYKQLLESGMSPAAALRQAQIAQMQKRSRQSPYYWAGFQLQGEWK